MVVTGSGSIFETLTAQKPLIVVPNPLLMDNHQVELGEQLTEMGHLVSMVGAGGGGMGPPVLSDCCTARPPMKAHACHALCIRALCRLRHAHSGVLQIRASGSTAACMVLACMEPHRCNGMTMFCLPAPCADMCWRRACRPGSCGGTHPGRQAGPIRAGECRWHCQHHRRAHGIQQGGMMVGMPPTRWRWTASFHGTL